MAGKTSVLGAAITGGASLLGSVLGISSQRKTNRMNYRIMQEQNSFNAREAQKNRDWQEQMYQKYSSVPAQVAQMRAAGLNPFLNGITPSEFSGSGAAASAAESATMSPYDYSGIGSAASSGVAAYQQQRNLDSTISLQKTQESLNKALEFEHGNNAEYWQQQTKLLRETLKFKTIQAKFEAQKSEWDAISSQHYSSTLQYQALSQAFQYGFGMPKLQCDMYMKQLDNVAFQLVTMRENANLTHAEFLYKMREYSNFYAAFGLQKYRAQTDRIAANAQSLNARTAAELMPHTAGMLDNQSGYYRGMAQNEGQKLYMSRKWDSTFKKLTYTALESRIKMQDSMTGYYDSGSFRNYVGTGWDISKDAFDYAYGKKPLVDTDESTTETYDKDGDFRGAKKTTRKKVSHGRRGRRR